MRYRIESRHQDEGWEPVDRLDSIAVAIERARSMACDGMIWGMVRVIDESHGKPIISFPGGGPTEPPADAVQHAPLSESEVDQIREDGGRRTIGPDLPAAPYHLRRAFLKCLRLVGKAVGAPLGFVLGLVVMAVLHPITGFAEGVGAGWSFASRRPKAKPADKPEPIDPEGL